MQKKFILSALIALTAASTFAADKDSTEGFRFTTVDSVAITPVKNQKNAGTCWSYSALGFLESELIRKTGKVYDFSEMFIVYNTYMDRADKAVRMHGDVSFSQGGSFYDVTYGMEHFGLVPDAEMPAGKMYGDTLSNHSELSSLTDPLVKAVANSDRKLQFSPDGTPLWKKALAGIYDVYLGVRPTEFTYEGKKYTPQSFYKSTGLNAKDYVSLTSFTHHPYSVGDHKGEGFIIEVQDNWRWASSINVELDDFVQIIEDAVKNGYTVAWGSDVSEDGFTRDGLAVYPDMTDKAYEELGSDQAKWLQLTKKEKREKLTEKPLPQKKVTPEERQRGYDNFETTDDHGMVIFGIAKDQEGTPYFMVKNSWGKAGKYNGIWYATYEFVRAKTLNYVVNREAISKKLREKYGI
jgi:aminopeptidase C